MCCKFSYKRIYIQTYISIVLRYTLGLDKMYVICVYACAQFARVINIDIELFVYIKEEYSRNHCVDYLNERFVGLLEEVIIQIESGNVCEQKTEV